MTRPASKPAAAPVPGMPGAQAAQDDSRLSPEEILAEYRAGPERLARAVEGMSLDEMRARPVPGKWSTLEVLCHLADCEAFMADRIKQTLALTRPLVLACPAEEYVGPLAYQEQSPADQLALFAAVRTQTGAMLERCAPPAWQRTVVHSQLGVLTLRQLVLYPSRHLDHHLPFIAEKRAALGR